MRQTGWQKRWVRLLTTLLTAAVMVMIFAFSTEDAEHSDRTSGMISRKVLSIIHPDYEQMEETQQKRLYDNIQHVVRKCAHFMEYMLLGLLLRLCLQSWYGHKVKGLRILSLAGLCTGTVYACTDEFHQLLIEGRSGQWSDIVVDGSGVLLGILIGIALIGITHRKGPE